MQRGKNRWYNALVVLSAGAVLVGTSACASASGAPAAAQPRAEGAAAAPAPAGDRADDAASSSSAAVLERAARADSVRASYNAADVAFMTDMIHHHAQALVMAEMAGTHGASDQIQLLAARIENAQLGEIGRMQRWLESRGQPVPDVEHMGMAMHGGHAMADMAGMLSPEQLAALDAARGEEFDRLFLTYMIQHHKGAVTMVDELFATYGAAQGDAIFQMASDIGADQSSEIDRMQRMLADMLFSTGSS